MTLNDTDIKRMISPVPPSSPNRNTAHIKIITQKKMSYTKYNKALKPYNTQNHITLPHYTQRKNSNPIVHLAN